MIRTLIFVALLAAAAPAAAEIATLPSTPTLKHAVTVSADIVRIGDLIDNAGAAADAPIFRSPDIGTTGSVTVQQVLEAIQSHHIYLIDTGAITEVQVTRAGRVIDLSDLEVRIARAFAGRYGLGKAEDLAVTLDAPAQPVVVDSSATGDLVQTNATLNQATGRFAITFGLPGSAARRQVRFTGTVVETVATAVTTRALASGAIVRPSDVAIERRPKAQIGPETITTTTDEAIGLAVRSALRTGQPLRHSDLMKPQIVRRDDNVTLVYEVPGILLTTRGKAADAGAEGDLISVVNVESKRTIQGIVSGPNRVTIMASTRRTSADIATAAIPPSVASR